VVADVDVEEGVVERGTATPMKITVAVTSLSRPMDRSLRGMGGQLSDPSSSMAAPHISDQKESHCRARNRARSSPHVVGIGGPTSGTCGKDEIGWGECRRLAGPRRKGGGGALCADDVVEGTPGSRMRRSAHGGGRGREGEKTLSGKGGERVRARSPSSGRDVRVGDPSEEAREREEGDGGETGRGWRRGAGEGGKRRRGAG